MYFYICSILDATSTEEYVCSVTWFWVNCRCISFCLDRIWGEVEPKSAKVHDLIEMFTFCFYLPVNISGPIMIYKDFHDGFHADYKHWTWQRLFNFLLQVMRYSFWFLFAHLILHYFYQSLMRYDMSILRSMGKYKIWNSLGLVMAARESLTSSVQAQWYTF